jgi:hypothetical protein
LISQSLSWKTDPFNQNNSVIHKFSLRGAKLRSYRSLEICVLQGYYARSIVNHLPTFRDSVSVPSSRAKKSKKKLSRKGIISWRCALSQKGAHLVLVFLKPCRTVFVVASQLPTKFSALCATQTFIAMFTLALRSQVKPFCPGSFGCNIHCTVLYCTVLYCTYYTVLYSVILYYTVLYYTVLYSVVLYSIVLYYTTVLYCTILYYTILYYTILYYTILYYTILYYTVLYCTILYCTVLYYTVLHYTILYCTILYCTVLYYTVLYCTILYYTILYYTILYYTVLYCTVLYCTVLYCTVLYCTMRVKYVLKEIHVQYSPVQYSIV